MIFRVRKDLKSNVLYGDTTFINGMSFLKGTEFDSEETPMNADGNYLIRGWIVTPEMLELVGETRQSQKSQMPSDKLRSIVIDQLDYCEMLLLKKGKEYAPKDSLKNFRVSAQLQSITNKQALGGYMAKHIVSIYDMINSKENYSVDRWEEKITDAINYLLLLKAMVVEESKVNNEQ